MTTVTYQSALPLRTFLSRRHATGLVIAKWSACACIALTLAPLIVEARESGAARVVARPPIPPGPLGQALRMLIADWDAQLLYSPELVAGRTTKGLRAPMPAAAALANVLQGSGVTAIEVAPNTYVLQPAATVTLAATTTPQQLTLPPVQVTGSRISRVSLQTSYPVTIITQDDIHASGAQSVIDYLQSWPGMNGHQPRDVAADGGAVQIPLTQAAGASLYALGPGATLYLLDGARIASYGSVSSSLGAIVDLNSIPLSMVERIEIANGASSAIYGSDAMAGVVNIILKKAYVGNEVSQTYTISERGDALTRTTSASHGTDLPSGGDLFVGVEHRWEEGLTGAQRSWATLDQSASGRRDARLPYTIFTPKVPQGPQIAAFCLPNYPGPDRCSLDRPRYVSLTPQLTNTALNLSYRTAVGARTDLQASVLISRTILQMQYPPYYGDATSAGRILERAFIEVGPVASRTNALSVNAMLRLTGLLGESTWEVTGSHSGNRTKARIGGLLSREAFAASSFEPDRYNPRWLAATLSPDARIHGDHSMTSATASVSLPALFSIASRPVSAVLGAEAREERLRLHPYNMQVGDTAGYDQDLTLDADRARSAAQFGELAFPIHPSLTVDAAWRLDWNENFSTQISPKLGAKWTLHPTLALRASYSEGYRAPTLYEQRTPRAPEEIIYAPPGLAPCKAADFPGVDFCEVRLRAVRNPNLEPETSTSSLFGVIWTASDHFHLSASHYNIKRSDEITLLNGRLFRSYPQVLHRDPSGVLTELHTYITNMGTTHLQGWQIELDYNRRVSNGNSLRARLFFDHLASLSTSSRPEMPNEQAAGASFPKTRVSGTFQWEGSNWSSAVHLRYRTGIRPLRLAPTHEFEVYRGKIDRVPAFHTIGASIATRKLDPWTISAGIENILDRSPINTDENFSGQTFADDDSIGRRYVITVTRRF